LLMATNTSVMAESDLLMACHKSSKVSALVYFLHKVTRKSTKVTRKSTFENVGLRLLEALAGGVRLCQPLRPRQVDEVQGPVHGLDLAARRGAGARDAETEDGVAAGGALVHVCTSNVLPDALKTSVP
jgi:hypothetical protein